ncbi:FAD-binding oxidoreductase [Klebsiella variicola subsp. variicola]|nr:FAD-binding oxidoreductase [Klebsiella variicola subsp. variicola]
MVACGLEANALLAENWLRPKKANWRLPIATGRGCSTSWLSWVTAPAPMAAAPRWRLTFSRGQPAQLLIGSSRQFDNRERELDLPLLAQMLDRARHFVPALATLNIIRCWSGLRAASQDGNPLIGPHPTRRGLWLALGHEGLGVTTAPATAELLAAQILDERCPVAPDAWLPARLCQQEAIA